MVTQQISAEDIRGWDSIESIADSLAGRGLNQIDRSEGKVELAFANGDTACVRSIGSNQSPEVALQIDELTQQHRLVFIATRDLARFDLYSKPAAASGLGQATIVHLGFTKSDIAGEAGTTRRLVERLNQIDGYDPGSLYEVFNDEHVIERFATRYQEMVDRIAKIVVADPDVSDQSRRHYSQRLLNRLLYLYLLQQTGVLQAEYLEQKLGPASVAEQNVYEEVYAPLFEGDIPDGDQSDLRPYLESFLFEKTPSEATGEVRPPDSASKANELFTDILKFMADWDWKVGSSYDIRHATSVTPRIIGHALERYINKQNTAAYHTPDRLRYSLVSQALRESLLRRLNEQEDEEYDSLEHLFEADLNDSDQIQHLDAIHSLYVDVLPDFYVVDPAVGSGSFIQEAQSYLADIYDECLQHLRIAQIDGQVDLPGFDTASERAQFSRQLAAHRNLFGVDLNPEATELTRFRLQLTVFQSAGEEPLHDLRTFDYDSDYNFFTGNSLIGFTDGPSDEYGGTQATLSNYSESDISFPELVREYRQIVERDVPDVEDQIKERAAEFEDEMTEAFLKQFTDYVDDEIDADQVSDQITPFHWWIGFPEIMATGGFDAVVSNPPWQDLKKVHSEVPPSSTERSSSAAKATPKDTKVGIDKKRSFFEQEYDLQGRGSLNLSGLFIERAMEIAAPTGVISLLVPGSLFNKHSYESIRQALIEDKELTRVIGFENHGIFPDIHRQYRFGLIEFVNSGTTDTLRARFRQTSLDVLFEDEPSFPVISRALLESYSESLWAFPPVETQRDVEAYETIVQHHSLDSLDGWKIAPMRGIHQTRHADTLFEEPRDYPIYRGRNIYQYTPDSTHYGVESPSYWGVNEDADQASAKETIRDREVRALIRRYSLEWDGDTIEFEDGSTIPVTEVPMPYEEYRIAYRDIATSSNERTVIAAVLPPNVLCVNTLHTIHPYTWRHPTPQIDQATQSTLFQPRYDPKELFCLLGLLNSTPFDFLLRSKIDTHLSDYLITESQAPKPSLGGGIFESIWEDAARLNCYGEQFEQLCNNLGIEAIEDVARRKTVQAGIDAAVFHAYGFDDPDLVWSVLESQPRVQNPRVLDEDYFETVIRQFEDRQGEFR